LLENGTVKLHQALIPTLAMALLAGSVPHYVSAQATKKEAASLALEWNQFRGPNRDGISPDTGLLKEWPAGGPPQVWKATGIGSGYSSVCVVGTKLFTMGESSGKTHLFALNVADGKILWQLDVGKEGNPGNQGAGPRSTPASDGTFVFAMSQGGEILCVQAATGKPVWTKSMSEWGGNEPGWGWSESPLLDGGQVLFSPGSSRASVISLNKMNGTPVWQAKVKGGAQYTSLAIAEIAKVRQYLYFNMDSISGIDSRTGATLWTADRKGQTAICSTPAYKDGIVFVSSGYGVGHNAFKIAGGGGKFQASELYSGKEMANHHGGFVILGDHVYGTNESALMCMELKTGKVAWQDRCVGKGSVISADGCLIVRGQDGGVALVEANPAAFKEKGRISLTKGGGNGAWANPVVAGGKLYIRDWETLICYDIKAK
jgi:outer membrane protein assembly factor BamB